MTIRSTTDEMLAARHDGEPYVILDGGGGEYLRCADHEDAIRALNESPAGYTMEHRPRVECIPSRDPLPWVSILTGERYSTPAIGRFRFDPWTAYARPEPNPILVAFRATLDHPFKWMRHPANWLGALDDEVQPDGTEHCWHHRQIIESEATPADIEDAYRVLTKIVGVFG